VIKNISLHNKKYLIGVLKVILKTNDLEIVKCTIESLIEELEEANIDNVVDNLDL